MGIIATIRRHAAIAAGDFGSMFKNVHIPPLPVAATRLITEINRPEPNMDRLVKLISSGPEITARVIKTVNSAMFSLQRPITDVKHAVMLLGVRNIRSIALAYATMDALPKPRSDLFDHEAYWTDSLFKAVLSRSLSKKRFSNQMEDVFTSSLLADLALPVLLVAWQEYYEPVVEEWKQTTLRLSEIERKHFGWDHAQAGAWIVRSWEFPEEMICYIGAHNLSWEKIRKYGLEDVIVVPIAVASISSSVLKPDPQRSGALLKAAIEWLSMTEPEFVDCLKEVRGSVGEIMELFGLSDRGVGTILDDLTTAVNTQYLEAEKV